MTVKSQFGESTSGLAKRKRCFDVPLRLPRRACICAVRRLHARTSQDALAASVYIYMHDICVALAAALSNAENLF